MNRRVNKSLIELSKLDFVSSFEASPDALVVVNDEGSIITLNQKLEKLTGYSAEELLGQSVEILVSLEYREKHRTNRQKYSDNPTSRLMEVAGDIILYTRDGTGISADISLSPVKAGEELLTIAAIRDMTKWKQVEKELRESKVRLDEAQRLVQLGSWENDLISNKLRWSDEVYRIFGSEPEIFGGTYGALLKHIHPDDRESVLEVHKKSSENRAPFVVDYRLLLKDETVKYIREHGESFFDDNGKAVRSIGTVQDITEKKIRENELIGLHAVVEASPDAISITDYDSMSFIYVNKSYVQVSGYAFEELLQMGPEDVLDYDRQELKRQFDEVIAAGNRSITLEVDAGNKTDSRGIFELNRYAIQLDGSWAIISRARNIDERKKMERELMQFRLIMDSSPDGMTVTDCETMRFVYANKSAVQRTNYTEDEFLQLGPMEMLRIDRQQLKRLFDEVIAAGEIGTIEEAVVYSKTGVALPIEVRRYALRLNGRWVITNISHDITQRKANENELLQFKAMVAASPDAATIIDYDAMCFIYVNETGAQRTGYSREELLKMGPASLLGVDPQELKQQYERVIAAGEQGIIQETEVISKSGEKLPTELRRFALRAGDHWLIISVSIDISERKLHEIAERTRAIVDNAVDGIISINELGIMESFNPAAEQLFGYSREEVIGQNVNLLMPEPYRGEHDGYLSDYQRTGEKKIIGIGREVEARRKDGSTFPIELSVSETPTPKGGVFTGLIRDISERKKFETLLKQARKVAEEANMAKSAFLANMSHEIRTPMNGVLGVLELLQTSTQLDENQKELTDMASESARSLLTIINEILDFSKIEAGQVTLETIPFNLPKMINNIAELMEQLATSQSNNLKCFIQDDVPVRVAGDPVRLRQVLVNLISNAIKFTHAGEVNVNVTLAEDNGERVILRFEVKDTGIGIPPDKQAGLFSAFNQADDSVSRKFGGTGLGLSISKQLAELMGGEIGVNSSEGGGSTFWFTAQFEKVAEQDQQQSIEGDTKETAETVKPVGSASVSVPADEENLQQEGRLILVAEDNVTNRNIIGRQLKMLGYQYQMASDGKEALAMWQEKPYWLVLCDCHMPEMDGYELARTIRQEEKDKGKGRMPIIAITASALQDDKDKCLAAGMDGYLSKPMAMNDLELMLQKWLDKETSAEDA